MMTIWWYDDDDDDDVESNGDLITAPLLSLFSQFLPVLRLRIKLTAREIKFHKEKFDNEKFDKRQISQRRVWKKKV